MLTFSCARYLSKLADQTMSLISPEHSKALVWNQVDEDERIEGDADDDLERVDRMFAFEVAKTKEEEEGINPMPGFTVGFLALVHPNEKPIESSV